MKRSVHWAAFFVLAILCSPRFCDGGLLFKGKHSGVVIFDRWGGCILLSGVHLMHISERTKDGLRQFSGQPIQVDAKEVYQPMNPGDGRIGNFDYLGPAPVTRDWVQLKGLGLGSTVQAGDDGKAVASITLENAGDAPVRLVEDELGFAVSGSAKADGQAKDSLRRTAPPSRSFHGGVFTSLVLKAWRLDCSAAGTRTGSGMVTASRKSMSYLMATCSLRRRKKPSR